MISCLVWAADAPPSPSAGGNILFYGLIVSLIGALGGSGFQFYKYRHTREREDDSLIASATEQAVKAAKEMLADLRLELKRAREGVEHLQSKLEAANERIVRLEAELEHAAADREILQRSLTRAIEKRAVMQEDLRRMQLRMNELEEVVRGSLDREQAREHDEEEGT